MIRDHKTGSWLNLGTGEFEEVSTNRPELLFLSHETRLWLFYGVQRNTTAKQDLMRLRLVTKRMRSPVLRTYFAHRMIMIGHREMASIGTMKIPCTFGGVE